MMDGHAVITKALAVQRTLVDRQHREKGHA
jgi:hypothetical protein